MIGRNGVEAGGCVFCQNINDTETRMGVEGGTERIVPSRGFDPVARILECALFFPLFLH